MLLLTGGRAGLQVVGAADQAVTAAGGCGGGGGGGRQSPNTKPIAWITRHSRLDPQYAPVRPGVPPAERCDSGRSQGTGRALAV